MAKKEEKKSVKPSQEKLVKNVLLKHPEVLYNARHLFRNENGITIVEDRVPRGDPDRKNVGQPFCQADLTEPDIRNLAKYASGIIDKGILKYDEKIAYEDALHRAINELDGGKYAGKVGYNTFTLILSTMDKSDKKGKREASVYSDTNLSNDIKEVPMQRSEEIKNLEAKLAGLKNEEEMAKVAEYIVKQTPEQREVLKAMIKAAVDQNDPKRWQKTMDSIGMTDKGPKKKEAAEEEKKEDKKEDKKEEKDAMSEKKEEKKEEKAEEKESSSPITELDRIAGELENSGDYELFKIAYQLDMVSDVLEGRKTAATLESEPDEPYMRKAFQWTVYKREKDENFMPHFSIDKTEEIVKAYADKPYGVEPRPYGIIKGTKE